MTVLTGKALIGGVEQTATAQITLPAPTVWQQGSLPVGGATYPVPSGALFISPAGDDASLGTLVAPKRTLRAAMRAVSSGQPIVARAGVYREGGWITPQGKRHVVQAYPGEAVWFDGSRPATVWTRTAAGWVTPYPVKLARFDASRIHIDRNPFANYSDQAWLDDVPLRQVEDKTTPGVGKFSVDQAAGTITVGTDPTGRSAAVSDLPFLLALSDTFSLYGVGIRRYSPQAWEGFNAFLYYGGISGGSTIENVVMQESGMSALAVSKADITINRVTVQDCWYSGINGTTCDGLTIRDSIVRRVNRGAWQAEPATAGVKVTRAASITLDHVLVQDTPGCAGFWLDVSCRDWTFVTCTADAASPVGPAVTGFNIESSDGGTIGGVQKQGRMVNCSTIGGHKMGVQIQSSGQVLIWLCDFYGTTVSLNIHQTYAGNPGTNPANLTTAESPWWCTGIEVHNTRGRGPALQLIAYDDVPKKILGADMISRLSGCWFDPAPPGSMVQLGKADGYRTSFNGFAALAAAPLTVGTIAGKLGTNYQGSTAPSPPIADPIPAVIAAVLGRPNLTGQHITGLISP